MVTWGNWSSRNVVALLSACILLGAASGCGADIERLCTEDTQIPCTCDDGLEGTLACSDGKLGACECKEVPKGVCRSDAQCDDGAFCNGREVCDPENEKADDHGCVSSNEKPFCDDGVRCTIDSCDPQLNRCVFEAPDEDGDGFGDAECEDADGNSLGQDCDDDNANRFPGNFEICDDDNVDEDCDETTFGLRDQDGDGAIDDKCCNGKNCGDDCNDKNIAERPLQPEFCDEVDNDCDGEVDEKAAEVPWYVDEDGDGFGTDAHDVIESCIPIKGRSLLDTDCNDNLPSRHPAQYEACDLADNNCNGLADEGPECGVPLGYAVIPGGGGVTPSASGGSSGSDGSGGGSASGGAEGTGGSGGTGGMDGTGGLPPIDLGCDDRDLSGAVEWDGAITGATNWSGVVHLTKDVTVGADDHLTVEAGTLVFADEGVRITASDGRFDISGTEEDPVKFCGREGQAGFWDGIQLSNADAESTWSWVLIADGGGGGVPGALYASAPIVMDHVLVRNSGDVGIYADLWGFGSSDVSVTESVNTGLVLNQIAALVDLPQGGSFDGNGEDVARILFSTWNTPVTMRDIGVPYLIKQNMQQNADGDLKIEAGVEIQMEESTGIEFGWNSSVVTVKMEGTEDEPIVFSGRKSGIGFWDGLLLQPYLEAGSSISHVVIKDAGSDGPAMTLRAAVVIDGLTLEDNAAPALEVQSAGFGAGSKNISIAGTSGVPLLLDANALGSMPADTEFADNDEDYVEIATGTYISSSGRIPPLELPYYFPSNTNLRGNTSVLTIEAGVHFLFGTGVTFEIGWNNNTCTLHVEGTASDPVVFDHVLGEQGGWKGLTLNGKVNTETSFEYLEIRNAGGDGNGAMTIGMNPAVPEDNLTNCSFINSEAWGIYVSSTDKTQDYSANGNTFSGNTSGDIGP